MAAGLLILVATINVVAVCMFRKYTEFPVMQTVI